MLLIKLIEKRVPWEHGSGSKHVAWADLKNHVAWDLGCGSTDMGVGSGRGIEGFFFFSFFLFP